MVDWGGMGTRGYWGGKARTGAGIFDPIGGLGEGPGDRGAGSVIFDPAGAFAEGGMLGSPAGVDFEGEMYDPRLSTELGQLLRNAAHGRGESVAGHQLRAGQEQATKRAQAVAGSQRGVNPALAARMGAQTSAAIGTETNRMAAMLRAREMEAARAQLMQSELSMEQMRSQQQMAYNQALLGVAMQNQQSAQQAQGGILSAAGGILGGIFGSDRTIKKKIKSADKDAKAFLDALAPSSYEYKEPDAPGRRPGKTYGVMAQDVKKSKVGRTFMTKTPDGKLALDIKGGLGALLATAASLGRRVNKLETAGATTA